jgi:hypothetical protein
MRADHVRFGPAFIDESEAVWIDPVATRLPFVPPLLHVGTILLCGPERLFLSGNAHRSNAR